MDIVFHQLLFVVSSNSLARSRGVLSPGHTRRVPCDFRLYANQHVGPVPSRVLCVTQSSLVYAVPVL